jgi:hypothetical protein
MSSRPPWPPFPPIRPLPPRSPPNPPRPPFAWDWEIYFNRPPRPPPAPPPSPRSPWIYNHGILGDDSGKMKYAYIIGGVVGCLFILFCYMLWKRWTYERRAEERRVREMTNASGGEEGLAFVQPGATVDQGGVPAHIIETFHVYSYEPGVGAILSYKSE